MGEKTGQGALVGNTAMHSQGAGLLGPPGDLCEPGLRMVPLVMDLLPPMPR